jgi:predicted metal-dependent hydrolase
MAQPGPVTPRRIEFRYPDGFDPMWTPAIPEFACAANSVSLMMPVIEPYFVRTVRAAARDLDEPLRSATEGYLRQESAHHAQHHRFNRLLVARYPALAPVERLLARAYGALERRGSAGFNLAVVAVSEMMAYSAARWADRHRRELFDRADPVAATLFLWHLAEEVEHKSSAHDVHRAVEGRRRGSRFRLLAAMAVALTLVAVAVAAGTTIMLAAERRLHHPMAWFRLIRWSIGFAFELLTNLVMSALPGHHPTDFVDPLWYEVWLRSFDAERGTLPLWDESDQPQPAVESTPALVRGT